MRTKWLTIALLLSLAVNFAIGGFVIGRHAAPPPKFDPTRGFQHWARTLPPERRAALRATIGERHSRPMHMRALLRNNQAVQDAIVAAPFDGTALQKALAELRTQHQQGLESHHHAFVAFVSALTLEERQQLAVELKQSRRRHPRASAPAQDPAS